MVFVSFVLVGLWVWGTMTPLGFCMVKFCKYFPDKRCFHECCSWFDGLNVVLCPLYCGGLNFTPRKHGYNVIPVFSKHRLRRGGC
jgi:hypothetical protein